MSNKDTCLAAENAAEQLEQAPAIVKVKEMHKLNSLKKGLREISTLLEEFDGQEHESGVAERLQLARDVAYETQDVIGPIVEATYQNQRSKLRRLLSGGRVTKHHVEINDIEQRIEKICSFKDEGGSNKEFHHSYSSISFKADEIVGFKDAKEALVRQLIGDSRSPRKEILIFGKAGSGKTTLAKMVCNDDCIKKHFSFQEWVSFSQELPLETLLSRILKHTKSPSNPTVRLYKDELKLELSESLKGKRYLVVIDNMHNSYVLDEFMSSFPDERNGSRILLTSPVARAGLHAQKRFSFSYEVKPLDLNESWQLFKALEGDINPDLEKLGSEMMERCKGNPRDIVDLAAVLKSAEKSEEMWSVVLKGYDALSNYSDLKELQFCLLYFGLFPINVDIPAKQMIQMWMAEGLLKQKGSERAEEIGELYLNKLISQSFIQVGTNWADKSVKTCRTYSHVSHLCISKGATEKFFEVHKNNSEPQKDIKRMAIHSDSLESLLDILKRFGDCSHAHSLHCFYKTENSNFTSTRSVDFWNTLLRNFRNLQVLNLGFLVLDRVPKELGKLTNLKYLRLRAPSVKHLPSSVVNLHQLETLDMRESHLVSLPHGIWKIQLLRHLYLGGSTSLPNTRGIDYYSALPHLQTLSGVDPDKVLKKLMVRAKFPNVRKLKLRCLDKELAFNFLNSLDHLYHLQSLRVENPTKLPDLHAFPLSLTKLTLLKTKLQPICVKTLENIPNLRILKLLREAICGNEIEFSARGFLQLEVLRIENLDVMKCTLNIGAMPCIKHFFIKECNFSTETAPDDLKAAICTK